MKHIVRLKDASKVIGIIPNLDDVNVKVIDLRPEISKHFGISEYAFRYCNVSLNVKQESKYSLSEIANSVHENDVEVYEIYIQEKTSTLSQSTSSPVNKLSPSITPSMLRISPILKTENKIGEKRSTTTPSPTPEAAPVKKSCFEVLRSPKNIDVRKQRISKYTETQIAMSAGEQKLYRVFFNDNLEEMCELFPQASNRQIRSHINDKWNDQKIDEAKSLDLNNVTKNKTIPNNIQNINFLKDRVKEAKSKTDRDYYTSQLKKAQATLKKNVQKEKNFSSSEKK